MADDPKTSGKNPSNDALETKLVNSQFFRTLYRRDPITGFLVLLGGAAVVLGSINDQGSLGGLGLLLVGGGIGLRSLLLSRKMPADRDRL